MKLVTASEMRSIERIAIQDYGIPGIILMEHAGKSLALKCLELIEKRCDFNDIWIIAGKGNNGGDGFVTARHLINQNIDVKVILLCDFNDLIGDGRVNYDILHKMNGEIISVKKDEDLELIRTALLKCDIIIDAIFGTGFKGIASGIAGEMIRLVNDCQGIVISTDLPSGMEADTGHVHGPCIKADYTLTFGLPKVGLFQNSGTYFCGMLEIIEISLPKELLLSEGLRTNLITDDEIHRRMPTRDSDGHKGDYGHVFVIGGSVGMTGAVSLACRGALHAGAGLVTAGIPETLNTIMEIKLTEPMTKPLPEGDRGYFGVDAVSPILDFTKKASVLAIGPGISTKQSVKELIYKVLPSIEVPMVIDADGLNILSEIMKEKDDFLKDLSVPTVITPHPGEMARLTGLSIEEIQKNRIKYAMEYAAKWSVVLVLKGSHTIVASPSGDVYLNTTGNPGMATGGSGDVLTGIISAFIAQGMEPVEAAVVGVYIHGRAGDLAAAEKGVQSLVASDIIEKL
jgi:NAD(P)H-hydrate epimerase